MSDNSRRDRLRERTVSEIKEAARAQLVAGGPAGISLRAIARDMGMTAPALYRYYPGVDSLVLEMATDLYTELRLACAAQAQPGNPLASLKAMAREFRRWVLAHPHESALMFGPRLPGMDQFHEQCADLEHAGAKFGALFCEPLIELGVDKFAEPPADFVNDHDELPPAIAAFYLTAWTRMYGVILAEAFGHLTWATSDPESLFESELRVLAESLVS